MTKCQHNVQKRLTGTIDMWCINCGAIKLGNAEWQLPLMKPEDANPDKEPGPVQHLQSSAVGGSPQSGEGDGSTGS